MRPEQSVTSSCRCGHGWGLRGGGAVGCVHGGGMTANGVRCTGCWCLGKGAGCRSAVLVGFFWGACAHTWCQAEGNTHHCQGCEQSVLPNVVTICLVTANTLHRTCSVLFTSQVVRQHCATRLAVMLGMGCHPQLHPSNPHAPWPPASELHSGSMSACLCWYQQQSAFSQLVLPGLSAFLACVLACLPYCCVLHDARLCDP